MSTPVPGGDGADGFLPARLRSLAIVAAGERAIAGAWWGAATRFFDRVRPAVAPSGGPVDPARVADSQGFWTDLVDVEVMPVVDGVLTSALRRVTGRETPTMSDSYVSSYLNQVGNRLVNLPDEVYALIVAEIETGIRDGLGIPEVTAAVQQVLTASGTDRWPNRARVIARTETMGAVNAGVFRGAQLDAELRGDPAPFKQWISTMDKRTRPTHRVADKQRTLLSEPFRVGGASLMFPGDPSGPAAEVIQCRCSLLPVVLGEVIDWTNRQYRGGTE